MIYYFKVHGNWWEFLANEAIVCVISLLITTGFSREVSSYWLFFIFCLTFFIFSIFSGLYNEYLRKHSFLKIEGNKITRSYPVHTTGSLITLCREYSFNVADIVKVTLYRKGGEVVVAIFEHQKDKELVSKLIWC